jgi:hypothetical protein
MRGDGAFSPLVQELAKSEPLLVTSTIGFDLLLLQGRVEVGSHDVDCGQGAASLTAKS